VPIYGASSKPGTIDGSSSKGGWKNLVGHRAAVVPKIAGSRPSSINELPQSCTYGPDAGRERPASPHPEQLACQEVPHAICGTDAVHLVFHVALPEKKWCHPMVKLLPRHVRM
jgi:hypothetical protein